MAIVVAVAVFLLTTVFTWMMRSQIERDKGVAFAALGRSITVGLGIVSGVDGLLVSQDVSKRTWFEYAVRSDLAQKM